jgi:hypothetical protein
MGDRAFAYLGQDGGYEVRKNLQTPRIESEFVA